MAALPSGRQFTISRGDARAVLVEVGGGVRSYMARGRELLDGYGEREPQSAARGQPLIPWPNRLRDGRYEWDGRAHRTALTEPAQGHAIHGFTRFANWELLDATTSRAVLGLRLHAQMGYPFVLDLRVEYELDDAGALSVAVRAANAGEAAAPYANGQHPYLSSPTGRIDDCVLTVPASSWLPTDERQIPTGVEPVDGTPYDFRAGRPLGELTMDYAFTDLARDAEGLAWVRLEGPGGEGAQVWVDEAYPYVELFTGDTLPDPARRRRGLGVEPMTCPPNGLQSGVDVVRLEPGGTHTALWGLRPLWHQRR